MRTAAILAFVATVGAVPVWGWTMQATPTRPRFIGGVDMVAITAIVRQSNGTPVTNLKRDDFELLDNGQPRAIENFESAESPVSLGLLVDFSGSMEVAAKLGQAHEAARQLLDWLRPGTDEVALFGFDTTLRELDPFGPAPGHLLHDLDSAHAFGETSIYDATASAGRAVAAHARSRRAVIVLTDGVDNSSHMTPTEVSGVASSIDVPVYVVLIVSPLDRFGDSVVDDRGLDAAMHGPLADLAHWTGGEIFAASSATTTSQMARQIVSELRHEYLIGFEPGAEPGWHAIDVRTRRKNLVVHARSGYVVQARPDASPFSPK